jgi:hypothetical protein
MFNFDGETTKENTDSTNASETANNTAKINLKCIQRDETIGSWNNTCDKTAVKDSKGKIKGYTCQC